MKKVYEMNGVMISNDKREVRLSSEIIYIFFLIFFSHA
tara:strand:- start:648 stop:761 length:114 start_codon:yes stop_codon:yes gene_type:complete